jgi:hypothetical protein
MDGLPTWAVWSIVVPLVLLSPVIALLLALAAEVMVLACTMPRFQWGWCWVLVPWACSWSAS